MKVVYDAANIIDAHLIRHALEAAEIPVFLKGEALVGGMGELPLFGVVQVCVPALKVPGVPPKDTALTLTVSASTVSAVAPPVPRITLPVVVPLRPTSSVSALATGLVSVSAIVTVTQAETSVLSEAR